MGITDHAYKRIRQRCKIPRQRIYEYVKKAKEKGLHFNMLNGSIKTYIETYYIDDNLVTNVIIYNNSIFVYNKKTLITCITLPQKFRKIVNKLKEKHEILNK